MSVDISGQLEALLYMVCARVCSRRLSPARSLWVSAQLADSLGRFPVRGGGDERARHEVEALVWRAHRLLAACGVVTDCYDRALAARWWLVRRAVSSEVVFGLRREAGVWEGHAWLEFDDGDDEERLFVEESLGYREIAREPGRAPVLSGDLTEASSETSADGVFGDAVCGVMEGALGARAGRPRSAARAMARAADLGLWPMLYRMRDELGLPVKPWDKMLWREHLANVLLRRRAMLDVLEHIQGCMPGVDVIVLKGEPLAQRLFSGDGLARRSSDIDLLVRLERVEEIASALGQIGYLPMYADHPEPWRYNQWALAHEKSGQVLELHWALAAPEVCQPEPDDLFEQVETIAFHGREIAVLSPAHTFLHLCLHFHNHVGFFKGLVDVAAWLDAYATSSGDVLEEALAQARRIGMEEICVWPLRAIEKVRMCGGGRASSARPRGEASIRAEIASLWTAFHVDQVLVRGTAITGAAALAFKTQEVLQVQVGVWRALGMLLLDRPQDVARAIWSMVFLGPEAMARSRGASEVEWRDWYAFAIRPVGLLARVRDELGARASA